MKLSIPFAAILLTISPQAKAQAQLEPTVELRYSSPRSGAEVIRTARPVGEIADWLRPADFPGHFFDGLGQYNGWATEVHLLVGEDGSVDECETRVWRKNAEQGLNRVCELLQERSQFKYAIDRSGAPLATPFIFSLSFGMAPEGRPRSPGPAPRPSNWQNTPPTMRELDSLQLPADTSMFVEPAPAAWVEVSERGRVQRCTITKSAGTDAGDVEICRRLFRTRFEPARTPEGEPAEQGTLISFGNK